MNDTEKLAAIKEQIGDIETFAQRYFEEGSKAKDPYYMAPSNTEPGKTYTALDELSSYSSTPAVQEEAEVLLRTIEEAIKKRTDEVMRENAKEALRYVTLKTPERFAEHLAGRAGPKVRTAAEQLLEALEKGSAAGDAASVEMIDKIYAAGERWRAPPSEEIHAGIIIAHQAQRQLAQSTVDIAAVKSSLDKLADVLKNSTAPQAEEARSYLKDAMETLENAPSDLDEARKRVSRLFGVLGEEPIYAHVQRVATKSYVR